MAMLKLNIADGRRLAIPAQTIKAIRGATPELLGVCPSAKSSIFYLICGQVRIAALNETVTTVKSALDQDRTIEAAWLEVEDHLSLPFFFQVPDVRGVTGLDPERPLKDEPDSAGCSVKIDLEFAPGVAIAIYARTDSEDVLDAIEPPHSARPKTVAPKARRRKR